MGPKLLFYWSANSLLFSVALLRAMMFIFAAWIALTLVATQVLGWIRGGTLVPNWMRSAGTQQFVS